MIVCPKCHHVQDPGPTGTISEDTRLWVCNNRECNFQFFVEASLEVVYVSTCANHSLQRSPSVFFLPSGMKVGHYKCKFCNYGISIKM